MNHFELLELPIKYDIDLKLLSQQYFAMQAKYHPDRTQDKDEKKSRLLIASQLNEAYATFKDDIRRAIYLLELKGIDISDLAAKNRIPAAQLQIIWSELEMVENTEEVKDLQYILEQKISYKENLLQNLLFNFNEEKLQDALDITLLLKYLVNLINSLKMKIKRANNKY